MVETRTNPSNKYQQRKHTAKDRASKRAREQEREQKRKKEEEENKQVEMMIREKSSFTAKSKFGDYNNVFIVKQIL